MEKMKEILFVTENKLVEEVIPMPKPAKFYLPDWYKNTTKFFNGNKLEFDESFNPLLTVKACMPLFDILSMGYIQETWCDIHISRINGALSYSYKYPEIFVDLESLIFQKATITFFFIGTGYGIQFCQKDIAQ
jgi:hypothetical protein